MIVTPELDRRNKRHAWFASISVLVIVLALAWVSRWWLLAAPLAIAVYYWIRRRTLRRLKVMSTPFPTSWESILQSDVAFYRALDDDQKDRFRKMVQIFLDETRITGIGTDVDDRTRVLTAASAVIPVFGFPDWEYSGLGEILIYPNAFGEGFRTDETVQRNTLGMVGAGYLNGVMILSKPDLIAGFANPEDKHNVGIHEFAHLVDKADGSIDGIPPGVPRELAQQWIQWIGQELKSTKRGRHHIQDYAYTNEAEYFAVLTEYFFEAPEILAKKNPELYGMLKTMYHLDAKQLLSRVPRRRKRVGRNAPCPCGSGKKFKHCCRRRSRKGVSV